MNIIKYRVRYADGKISPLKIKFYMSSREFQNSLGKNHVGYCTNPTCGAKAMNVEPDAERYVCQRCKQHSVFGLEQLLLLNKVRLDAKLKPEAKVYGKTGDWVINSKANSPPGMVDTSQTMPPKEMPPMPTQASAPKKKARKKPSIGGTAIPQSYWARDFERSERIRKQAEEEEAEKERKAKEREIFNDPRQLRLPGVPLDEQQQQQQSNNQLWVGKTIDQKVPVAFFSDREKANVWLQGRDKATGKLRSALFTLSPHNLPLNPS